MRKRNWRNYNKELVQRGSLTFLIEPKLLSRLKNKRLRNKRGRPEIFSDRLIELLLVMKIHFKLAYRALEGFAKWAMNHMKKGLRIPTFSLICKRAKALGKKLPMLSSKRPAVILLDSSDIKILGEGEWKVKIHGRGRPRKWLKLHIAVDANSQEIVGELLTTAHVADSAVVGALLSQTSKSVKLVIADGAYDRTQARNAIKNRNACALIPPPRNARYRGTGSQRDQAVPDISSLGGDLAGRSLWGKLSGYSQRALVETAFSRYKRLFSDKFFSKTIERQIVENRLKCCLLNKMRRQVV